MVADLLPAGTRVMILASGKIGHEVNCLGVAAALGVAPDMREIRPRKPFVWLSPWGPVDPADRPRAPFPDIALASGRATVPYLRHLKRRSRGKTFTAFLQDPRDRRGIDLIWTPEHDSHRGANVMTTLTSPHPLTPSALAKARAEPDPRLAGLPHPRVALILGGPSAAHRFEPADVEALAGLARSLQRDGAGVMATPSRRTPEGLLQAVQEALAGGPAFVWDRTGDNPYLAMLAGADTIVATGDSVNMLGEAAATGAPVHVYEPSGGSAKMTRFIDALVATGAARRWSGRLESWRYEPLDATAAIAAGIARRYRAFRGASPV